jgi:hypothetical protein
MSAKADYGCNSFGISKSVGYYANNYSAGPIMLAAASLAVYSVIHGALSASIAFTALTVFGRLEFTLAVIPELTTYVEFLYQLQWVAFANAIGRDLLDALVSINRIEKYLDSPERGSNTAPGDVVSFHNASVTWPSDNLEEGDRFILRNINLSFPSGELRQVWFLCPNGILLTLSPVLYQGRRGQARAYSLHPS